MRQFNLNLMHIGRIEAFNQINEVLENFAFDFVHEYMKSSGWGWGLEKKVPTKKQLKEEVEKQLIWCIEALDRNISKKNRKWQRCETACGGFHTSADWYRKPSESGRCLYVNVQFSIEAWDTAE